MQLTLVTLRWSSILLANLINNTLFIVVCLLFFLLLPFFFSYSYPLMQCNLEVMLVINPEVFGVLVKSGVVSLGDNVPGCKYSVRDYIIQFGRLDLTSYLPSSSLSSFSFPPRFGLYLSVFSSTSIIIHSSSLIF